MSDSDAQPVSIRRTRQEWQKLADVLRDGSLNDAWANWGQDLEAELPRVSHPGELVLYVDARGHKQSAVFLGGKGLYTWYDVVNCHAVSAEDIPSNADVIRPGVPLPWHA
jgi:hypothetical protein